MEGVYWQDCVTSAWWPVAGRFLTSALRFGDLRWIPKILLTLPIRHRLIQRQSERWGGPAEKVFLMLDICGARRLKASGFQKMQSQNPLGQLDSEKVVLHRSSLPRPQARKRRNSEFFNRPMCAQRPSHLPNYPIISPHSNTDTTGDQKATNPPEEKSSLRERPAKIQFQLQFFSKLRRLLPALGTMMARHHFASQVPRGTLQGRLQVLRAGGLGLKRPRYGLYVIPPHSEEVLLGLVGFHQKLEAEHDKKSDGDKKWPNHESLCQLKSLLL